MTADVQEEPFDEKGRDRSERLGQRLDFDPKGFGELRPTRFLTRCDTLMDRFYQFIESASFVGLNRHHPNAELFAESFVIDAETLLPGRCRSG